MTGAWARSATVGRSGRRPVALTVAGTDSGGGAGIVADVKTFEALGVWATVAVTAVTAQDTREVSAVHPVPVEVIVAQIDRVIGDIGVDAAKTGVLGTGEAVVAVADALRRHGVTRLVVDPVAVASTGGRLSSPAALAAIRERLLPLALVVTPNLAEAAALTGLEVTDRAGMVRAGQALCAAGVRAALVTGGHLEGPAADCLVIAGGAPVWLEGPRLAVADTHGTGCVLSASLCAHLAGGVGIEQAARAAKAFTASAIAGALRLGGGAGPVDPGWARAAEVALRSTPGDRPTPLPDPDGHR